MKLNEKYQNLIANKIQANYTQEYAKQSGNYSHNSLKMYITNLPLGVEYIYNRKLSNKLINKKHTKLQN